MNSYRRARGSTTATPVTSALQLRSRGRHSRCWIGIGYHIRRDWNPRGLSDSPAHR